MQQLSVMVVRVLGRLAPCVLIGFVFGALMGYAVTGAVIGVVVATVLLTIGSLDASPYHEPSQETRTA